MRHTLIILIALAAPAYGSYPSDPLLSENPRGQALARDYAQQRAIQQQRAYRGTPQGQFRAQPTDLELAQASGLDMTTGQVKNSADSLFKFELDSKAAWVPAPNSLKLGIAATLLSLADKNDNTGFRLALDLFNNLVGASLNYVFEGTLRPALGAGYGTFLGTERTDLRARGKDTNAFYFSASFRIW